ncbi:MAG: ZmpA/ZmpB/ZmpC family metallo-endopeptidase-related protein [Paludibacter sp.]|nr:ZmpA/ZmpB/ZmpC family metallo-endopeptidase-related protein [Paludibacter sp.]
MKQFKLKQIMTGVFILLSMSLWSQTTINDEAGLRAMADNLAGNYILGQDITLSSEWTPVGTDNAPFTGTFNGNGKVIKNLQINLSGSDRIGFFGHAQNATIQNAGFENVNVVGRNDVGAIVGRLRGATVNQCYVTGYVEGNDHVGAIVGGGDGDAKGTISNCYAYTYIYTRSSQVGGIIGTIKNTHVLNSYFAGQVVSPSSNTGGIASLIDGGSDNKIECCINMALDLKGNTVRRILANDGGGRPISLVDNYAYEGTLVKGVVVPDTDADFGPAKKHGGNYTLLQLKSQATYDYLIWDFTDTWKLPTDGFPVFKNQTLPLNLDAIVNMPTTLNIADNGKTYQLTAASIVPGKVVSFISSDETKATVTASGLITTLAPGEVTITAATQTDGFTNGVQVQCVIQVKAVTSNITNAAQLDAMRYDLNREYQLMNDVDLAGTEYEDWTPINNFGGKLEGNGHVIKNLKVNDTANDRVAFIGYTAKTVGSTIRNLGFENATITGGTPTAKGTGVAVVVGRTYGNVLIENCYVSNSKVIGRDHVSLLVGRVGKETGDTGTVIRNCYVTGSIKNYANKTGGLIGQASNVKIENCYSTAAIDGIGSTASLVGYAYQDPFEIKNCVALSPYVKGTVIAPGVGPVRIVSEIAPSIVTKIVLSNNHGLHKMKEIDGSMVYLAEDTDPASIEGKDVTLEAAKEQTFYQTTLGWDFDDIWKMLPKDGVGDSGIFPVLKWQTAKVNAHVYALNDQPRKLLLDEEFEIEAYGSHGQAVNYASSNNDVASVTVTEGVAKYKGLARGTIDALLTSAATSYMNAGEKKVEVKVYDPTYYAEIHTAEQFNNMRDDLYENYVLKADVDLAVYTNFSPIGTDSNNPYIGKFNGDGHVVRNLTMNRPGDKRQGLFGYTRNAVIENVGLENVNVVGEGDVGGVVGKGVGTTIQKVYVTGYVEGIDHVGGIIGGTDGGNLTTVQNCYVDATIKTRSSQVGGIMGVASSSLIDKVYYTGEIIALTDQARYNAGGIIGLIEDGNVSVSNLASLPTSVSGGTVSEFIARASGTLVLKEATNLFARNDVVFVCNAPEEPGFLPKATEQQKRDIAVFKSKDIYETSMGWDFTNIWQMPDDGFPILKTFTTGLNPLGDKLNAQVYSTNGFIHVVLKAPMDVQVFDLTGKSVKLVKAASDKVSVMFPRGIYIVKTGSTFTKVVN